MHCQQANELFSDYIEGKLDQALTVSVENHLAACPSCHEEMAGLRRVWAQLDQMPVLDAPATLHATLLSRLNEQLAQEEQQAQRSRFTLPTLTLRDLFRPRALALAATLLIFMLGSAELVQTQRAELGPIGFALRLLHLQNAPVPLKATVTGSNWVTQGGTGGALNIRLRVSQPDNATVPVLNYQARLVQGDPHQVNLSHAPALASAYGSFASSGAGIISLKMEHKPDTKNLTLMVTLTPAEASGGSAQSTVIAVPLTMQDQ